MLRLLHPAAHGKRHEGAQAPVDGGREQPGAELQGQEGLVEGLPENLLLWFEPQPAQEPVPSLEDPEDTIGEAGAGDEPSHRLRLSGRVSCTFCIFII